MSRYYEEFEVGARYPTYGRTITEADLALFCAVVGYHVPLFIDEEYAKNTSYGGRILPSAMIMSVSTAMTESLFRTTMIALLEVGRGRFLEPVKIGDTITTEVEVISRRETKKPQQGLVVFRDQVFNQHRRLVFEIDKTTLVARRPPG